ncbi:MAG: phosphatidylglycerol lysyltransferase domain-containing protein [Acidobacteriia bacterium]|nr:phosphatidylglycerol lysyltransferase domain-containing protein [Terriglobia bacterium]
MDAGFLGLRFVPVEMEHRPRLADLLARNAQPLSDYSFASLFVWAPVFRYLHVVVEPDTLLVGSDPGAGRPPSLLQPVGPFPVELQETLLSCAGELPEALRIEAVSAEFLERHAAFAAHFDVVANRDAANYVYAASDLAELRGRRYAGKRNLLAQASRLYAWSVERLGPEHVEECLVIGDDIARKRTAESAVTLAQETQALERALRHLGPLGLQGLLVRVEGEPSAFSIFDRLNPTTAVVFFERALRSRKGLYQVINRETARVIASQGFTLINREEDLGDPGLRKGKLSYFPVRLEMKHTLTLRR